MQPVSYVALYNIGINEVFRFIDNVMVTQLRAKHTCNCYLIFVAR